MGLDPGATTGIALVDVGPAAPFTVHTATTVRDRDLAPWLRDFLQTSAAEGLAGIVVEDWLRYGGPRGAIGAAQAAFATGHAWGVVQALWSGPSALLARPTVLSALGLKANATKRVAWRMTAKLAMVDLDASGHTIDAVAAAIAGAGRLEAA